MSFPGHRPFWKDWRLSATWPVLRWEREVPAVAVSGSRCAGAPAVLVQGRERLTSALHSRAV